MTTRTHSYDDSARTPLPCTTSSEAGRGRTGVRAAALCGVFAAGVLMTGCMQSVSSTWTHTAPPIDPVVRQTDASQFNPPLRAGLSQGPIARNSREE